MSDTAAIAAAIDRLADAIRALAMEVKWKGTGVVLTYDPVAPPGGSKAAPGGGSSQQRGGSSGGMSGSGGGGVAPDKAIPGENRSS